MNYRTTSLNMLAWAVAAGLLVQPSFAQNATDRSAKQRDASQAAERDGERNGVYIRASELMGLNIENSAQNNVGSIDDLVLDTDSREIRYVAVTYGGFLGIGSEMHAVPFKAFNFRGDPDAGTDIVAVLDVTQKQMEGAKGFDEKNWPNFGDEEFARSADRRYGVKRTPKRDRKEETQRDAKRSGKSENRETGANIRASELFGLSIENSARKNVGTVNDLIVNVSDGNVPYAIVSYGGFLGIGDELHAVPVEALKWKTDPDNASETVLVLDVTQEQMKGAKGLDEDNWPDFSDERFTREIDKRYGIDERRDSKSVTHDGKVVSISGNQLVMTNTRGKEEHTCTLTSDVKITCDGEACQPSNLKPGMRIRVTTEGDDPRSAVRIEALDKDADFAAAK